MKINKIFGTVILTTFVMQYPAQAQSQLQAQTSDEVQPRVQIQVQPQAPVQLKAFEIDSNIISIFGSACEIFNATDARSSTRLKATDKASFKAVENIPELSKYKKTIDTNDFNVIIYNIVDNYLEDLNSKTISQNDNEICVEISAYLNSDNIVSSLSHNETRKNELEDAPTSAPILKQENQIEIKEDKYNEEMVLIDEIKQVPLVAEKKKEIKLTDENQAKEPKEATKEKTSEIIKNIMNYKTKVYIADTKFFNGATTPNYAEFIKDIIFDKQIEIIDQVDDADYIIKPEVKKAKVDPINKQTSRLQMVVAVSLENPKAKTLAVEHQNRFILFEKDEDEQDVANDLIEKLLKKATKQVMMEFSPAKNNSIITPVNSTHSQKL